MTNGDPPVRGALRRATAGLFRLEGMMALSLAAFPFILMGVDGVRGSVSSYHEMAEAQWYYVPLTWAVVMLIVNGLVRPRHHGYNAVLGLLLLLVVLLDHDGGSRTIHVIAAVAFFVFALAFTILQLTDYLRQSFGITSISVERGLAGGLAVVVATVLAILHFAASTFWLESVALWLIAANYLYHSGRHLESADDDARTDEPTTLLKRLFEPLYNLFAFLLTPVGWAWQKLTSL